MPDVFRILAVCTGNVCRSPQTAQLIRARVEGVSPQLASQVVVESAGTDALVGASMPHEAAALSAVHGGDPEGHVARQLTADMVRGSDLVLAMAREHRRSVVRLVPRASRYTFTLTEFAALVESVAEIHPETPQDWPALGVAEKLRAAVEWTAARRGFLSADDMKATDIVDPYRRSDDVYAESAQQIVGALDRAQHAAAGLSEQVGA